MATAGTRNRCPRNATLLGRQRPRGSLYNDLHMNRATMLVISLSLMTVSPVLSQIGRPLTESCPTPQFPGTPTAIDSTCGTQGSGQHADGIQDAAKNNFCAPGPPQAVTFDQLKALQAAVQQNRAINFGNPSDHPFSTLPGATTDRR